MTINGKWVATHNSIDNGRTWDEAGFFGRMELEFLDSNSVRVSQFGMTFKPVRYEMVGDTITIPEYLITAVENNGELFANVVNEGNGGSMIYRMRRK